MAFLIEEEIWEKFPEMLLVVGYVENIDNSTSVPLLNQDFENVQANLKATWKYSNAQSHPYIAAWRETFQKTMKISGKEFPSAIEALCKRVLSGKGIADINPIVNFYNMVSMQYVVPVGGWDVDDMYGGNIYLRPTKDEERFTELGQWNPVYVKAGEIAYTDDDELITRHFVWRQSETAKVTDKTKNLFLVSEILSQVGSEIAQAVQSAFSEGLKKYFNVESETRILRKGDTCWDWK